MLIWGLTIGGFVLGILVLVAMLNFEEQQVDKEDDGDDKKSF